MGGVTAFARPGLLFPATTFLFLCSFLDDFRQYNGSKCDKPNAIETDAKQASVRAHVRGEGVYSEAEVSCVWINVVQNLLLAAVPPCLLLRSHVVLQEGPVCHQALVQRLDLRPQVDREVDPAAQVPYPRVAVLGERNHLVLL